MLLNTYITLYSSATKCTMESQHLQELSTKMTWGRQLDVSADGVVDGQKFQNYP